METNGVVASIDNSSNLYQRLLDIGAINGTLVECVLKSPCGDPKAYLIRGAVIAIRDEDAECISIDRVGVEHEK